MKLLVHKVSIGFSRPKTWKPLAKLIMLIEGTEYSHVFITWHCSEINRRKVFEAVGAGIRILSNVNFKSQAEVVALYDFNVDDLSLITIEQKAHDLTGRSYDFKAIIGLALMRLSNLWYRITDSPTRIGNPFKDGDFSQLCVEAGGMVLEQIEHVEIPYEDFGLTDMETLCAAYCDSFADKERLDRINGKTDKTK